MASVVLSLPSTHSLAFAMALQFSLSPSPALRSSFFSSSSSSTSTSTAANTAFASPGAPRRIAAVRGERRRARVAAVSSRLETAEVAVGQVTEVNNDTFWPIVKAAGSMIVVLDMYTQWCGPCKVMAPKFQELSKKYLDVVFLKLDCNQGNRPLAKELGIRVVPTFKILKDNKVVEEVRGAKLDDLVLAIEAAKSG